MTTYGYSVMPTVAPEWSATAENKAVVNKLRELEKKIGHLDDLAVESDDIETESTLQQMER